MAEAISVRPAWPGDAADPVAFIHMAKAGCNRLSLIVLSGKPGALAFHVAIGFRSAGDHVRHLQGPLVNGPDWLLLVREC